MKRIAIALAAALFLGCAKPQPVTQLTFVTTRDGVVEPEILATDVEYGWCYTMTLLDYFSRFPWRASLVPNYGFAVRLALDSVPGANIMTDVAVERRRSEYLLFRRVCSTVTGNAGRIE
jgi:hypothetical protein